MNRGLSAAKEPFCWSFLKVVESDALLLTVLLTLQHVESRTKQQAMLDSTIHEQIVNKNKPDAATLSIVIT